MKKKIKSLNECFDELASKEEFTTYKAIEEMYDPEGRADVNSCLRQKVRRLKRDGKLEVLPGSRPTQFRYLQNFRYALTRKEQKRMEQQLKSSQGKNQSRLYLTEGLSLIMEGQHAPEPKFEVEEIRGLRNANLITQTNLESCLGNKIIQFHYKKMFEEETTITFSPAFLKEYNSRWSICGFRHDLGSEAEPKAVHIPLDRIIPNQMKDRNGEMVTFKSYSDQQAIEQLGIRFKRADPGYFEKRYQDVVGMTVPDDRKTETIIIKALTYRDYMYLKTKPIHPSQQEVFRDLKGGLHPYNNQQEDHHDDRKEWLFTIQVKWNFELMAKILSYGKGLCVEGCSDFTQRIKSEIAEMARNYGLSCYLDS